MVYLVNLYSIPVGVPGMAGTPGSQNEWLENQGKRRKAEYIPRQPGGQEKKSFFKIENPASIYAIRATPPQFFLAPCFLRKQKRGLQAKQN